MGASATSWAGRFRSCLLALFSRFQLYGVRWRRAFLALLRQERCVGSVPEVCCSDSGVLGTILMAAGMLTMGAIVLSDILPIEVRGSYQSINNLAWGAGSVMGAATGGWLADHVGWRWEFGMQVPFGIFCIGVLYYTIPGPKSSEASSAEALVDRFRDFDFAGSFFLTTSLSFLILGMSAGGNVLEWTDWRVVSCLAVGLLLGNFLLRAEMKALSPVMPLRLLCSTPRGLIVFNNFFTMVAINAVCFLRSGLAPLTYWGYRFSSTSLSTSRPCATSRHQWLEPVFSTLHSPEPSPESPPDSSSQKPANCTQHFTQVPHFSS